MGGCGSSLRGDDIPQINANAKPSYMRSLSSAKPSVGTEHYQTAAEHDADLQRLQSSQSQRRPSRPAYVDLPDMPPKTTHQHYHRNSSANEGDHRGAGWKDMVKKTVMVPKGQRGMGENTGVTQEEALATGYPSRGSNGVIVPNGQRHRSYIG